jgi:hypothetical protein
VYYLDLCGWTRVLNGEGRSDEVLSRENVLHRPGIK